MTGSAVASPYSDIAWPPNVTLFARQAVVASLVDMVRPLGPAVRESTIRWIESGVGPLLAASVRFNQALSALAHQTILGSGPLEIFYEAVVKAFVEKGVVKVNPSSGRLTFTEKSVELLGAGDPVLWSLFFPAATRSFVAKKRGLVTRDEAEMLLAGRYEKLKQAFHRPEGLRSGNPLGYAMKAMENALLGIYRSDAYKQEKNELLMGDPFGNQESAGESDGFKRNGVFQRHSYNPEAASLMKFKVDLLLEALRILKTEKPLFFSAVDLFYFQEFSLKEIALELGIPVDTVKVRLFRAKQSLAVIIARLKVPKIKNGHSSSEETLVAA